METGKIVKVSGPLIVAEGMSQCKMYDVVHVSEKKLIGEVIELRGDRASIQVYEETSGLGPGENVYSTGAPLSVELAPGLIEGIYDGIQRPLAKLREVAGDRIERGVYLPAVDHEKKWTFEPRVTIGDSVESGSVLGVVHESVLVEHQMMTPYGVKGAVKEIKQRKTFPERASRHGTKSHRYAFPDCKGRRCGSSRSVRKRKNRCSAPTCKVGGRGYNRVRRLRRARKRNDGRSQ